MILELALFLFVFKLLASFFTFIYQLSMREVLQSQKHRQANIHYTLSVKRLYTHTTMDQNS